MKPETAIVFHLTRSFFGQPLAPEALHMAQESAGWERALEIAQVHGVEAICHEALRRVCQSHPQLAGGMDAFRRARYVATVRNMRMVAQLVEVLDALGSRGIEPIILKGAALALTVYEEPSLRPMRDLDLLVRVDALAGAREALLQLGYATQGGPATRWEEENLLAHLIDLTAPGRLPVEIHFRLFPRAQPLFPEEERVWDRAAPFSVEGRKALRLAPSDELMYLCGHLRKHAQSEYRLVWFCDIAALDGQIQPEARAAFDAAMAAHPERVELENVLRTARIWFLGAAGEPGLAAPAVMESPLTASDRHLPEALDRIGDLLGHMPTWSQKARFVMGYLFPRLSYLKQFHGVSSDPAGWGWRVIRPFWVVARAVRSYLAKRRRNGER